MADEVIFNSEATNHVNVKYRDPASSPRDTIRIAIGSIFYVDTIADLPGDADVDILDWVEVMASVDLAVGASSINLYLNNFDKKGTVGLLVDALIGWPTLLGDITLGALSLGSLPLGGAVQELWVSNDYIDWSVQANREAFTFNGVPLDLGASLDGGTGVLPFLYVKGAVGSTALVNSATAGGAFTEIGTVAEEGTYPLYPGSVLPTGQLDDDTFAYADALLGDDTLVASGGYGSQQQFFDVLNASIHNAVGVTMLQQKTASPVNLVPLEIRSSSTATGGTGTALKGGVVKNTDAYDYALDTALTPSAPVGYRSRVGTIIHDGVRAHNTAESFDLYRHLSSDGVDEDPESGTGYFEIRNSWASYGRRAAIRNAHFMSGIIEDSLIDGCHTFLSCNNSLSTVDQSANTIEIRDCLIWLRMLPYPSGHGGEALPSVPLGAGGAATAWGHGPLFDWHVNAPSVKIYDTTFYVEYYPATTADAANWAANAADNLGFIQSFGSKLTAAANNKIVWAGPGGYPGTIPAAHTAAFTVFNYGDDPAHPKTHFFVPRNTWINDHPLVGTVGDSLFDAALDYDTFGNQPYADYPSF